MKVENQVVSLDLALRLKELGVKQDSVFHWTETHIPHVDWTVRYNPDGLFQSLAAFTATELGAQIRNQDWFEVWADFLTNEVRVWFTSPDSDPDYPAPQEDRTFVAETEADARALALIYLIENGMVKT